MKAEFIRIVGWNIMQHYSKRTPPWIKLHRDILRDYTFGTLSDHEKLLVISLWLLASQMDNKVPNDTYYLHKQLPIDEDITKENIQKLVSLNYIEIIDSEVIASCYQDAILETEAKKETKTKKEAYTEESDEMVLSRLLFDLQLKNFPKMRKPNFQSWADEMRKLIHNDGVEAADVREMIEWVVTDIHEPDARGWKGWAPNIRSTKTLRKQWERLCTARPNIVQRSLIPDFAKEY